MEAGLTSTRCVFIGDHAVGKTCVIQTYLTGEFPKEYKPTVICHEGKTVEVDGTRISLQIVDSSGDDSYFYLRRGVYKSADTVILCFSMVNQDSIDSVTTKWLPEVKSCCPKAQLILLGTKSDMQKKSSNHKELPAFLKHPDALELINEFKAVNYLECSALKREGLEEIFEDAIVRPFQDQQKNQLRTSQPQLCILQ